MRSLVGRIGSSHPKRQGLPFAVGDYREVMGRRVKIIGRSREAVSFTTSPIAFLTYDLVQELSGAHSGAVMAPVFAGPDDDMLWAAGRDGLISGWDLSGRRPPYAHQVGATGPGPRCAGRSAHEVGASAGPGARTSDSARLVGM